jgi:hypothetical protein
VHPVTKTGRGSAAAFLTALVKAVPYKIHAVLPFRAPGLAVR